MAGCSPARRKLGSPGTSRNSGMLRLVRKVFARHIRNWKHLPFVMDERHGERFWFIQRSQPASLLVTPELDATSTDGAAMCAIEGI